MPLKKYNWNWKGQYGNLRQYKLPRVLQVMEDIKSEPAVSCDWIPLNGISTQPQTFHPNSIWLARSSLAMEAENLSINSRYNLKPTPLMEVHARH